MKSISRYGFKILSVSLIASGLLFSGCVGLRGIRSEYDVVTSTNRYKSNFTYLRTQERFSSLSRVNQSVVGERTQDGSSKFRVYDVVVLNGNGFRVSEEVYVIVDKAPHKVIVDLVDRETLSKNEEVRSSVLTSDSTTVSVVTGFNQYEQRVNRIAYTLDNALVDAIKQANRVYFRYYAGPDMITVRMNSAELRRLKKLFNRV
ncbi:MAG: hypothetical protein RBT74_06635 [Tenuifilaceae bacterium]|jgi:predicted nucleic acid-binding OB-fold protein|nr:hypothetical protein [Tenuifilaceae bacterium]